MSQLGCYYIDLDRSLGEDFSEYEFNAEGIPLVRFHRQPNWQHNPITVSQYGLYHYNRYCRTQAPESRQLFLKLADWLVDQAMPTSYGSLTWFYQVAMDFYRITPIWISGMAQAQAISLLLRAHQQTGDTKYLQTAQKAWPVLQLPVQQTGVLNRFPDERPIIEEYPSPFFLTGVLNGFIFAIFGVHDYALYTETATARDFFDELIFSLQQNLWRYDSGFWSYYDLKPPLRLASRCYHRLHIRQLQTLFEISGTEIFKTYAESWQRYATSRRCRIKWLCHKIRQKLLLRI
ncbi:MAG: D-glucuronyl C5-epimerase family protein [candidate division KSB1 bacterium]|nr:D-glucuronyl C5-epimerase family protein [candidate division KSB1 bacterium]MDZ7318189.1 D-glucuronyl C5-epimerase family protein [candidate division KSB1 bacterium]MDZ7340582.1 D-glucuronyl C5-epimerase family protein [candidate division KSB1 bacterium]